MTTVPAADTNPGILQSIEERFVFKNIVICRFACDITDGVAVYKLLYKYKDDDSSFLIEGMKAFSFYSCYLEYLGANNLVPKCY